MADFMKKCASTRLVVEKRWLRKAKHGVGMKRITIINLNHVSFRNYHKTLRVIEFVTCYMLHLVFS